MATLFPALVSFREFPGLFWCRRLASAAPAASSSSSTSASAGVAAVATGGISESLKAANRALVEKIKAQLSNDEKFGVFKNDSGEFQRGGISAQTYHDRMVSVVEEARRRQERCRQDR